MSSSKPAYPAARRAPETVTFGAGISFDDPYRWMEDDSAESLAWQAAQNALTQGWLKALPTYDLFADRAEAFSAGRTVSLPKYAGGRWFRQYVPDGEELNVVELCENPEGPGRRVIDLNAMRKDEPLQLEFYRPSPDGKKIVFSWNTGGREGVLIQVIDVDSGALLLDGLPQSCVFFTTWLPNSSGFYYQASDLTLSQTATQIYLHKLGETPASRPEAADLENWFGWASVSADGRTALIFRNHLAPKPDYIRAVGDDDVWRPFLKDETAMFRGVAVGDQFIAITNDGASRGRLVSIPLATPTQRETWRELIAASDDVLGSVLAIGERIVLMDLVDSYSRIRVLGLDGKLQREIELPGRGLVNSFGGVYTIFAMMDPMSPGGPDEIVYLFNSPTQGPALYLANVATGAVRQLSEPTAVLDAIVTDGSGLSADGQRIPYRLVRPREVDTSRPQPTIIFGYGGFNAAFLPGWIGAMWGTWVQAGGSVVLAHLRGGGEFGPDWWTEGRLKLKQNTFNDVYAIAEDLIARGVTTPEMLGATGGSNGGTMAAACAVQRPDLFRASVSEVPITDALGRRRDPVSMGATADYGDPDDAEMAPVLRAWSPYQNIKDGVAYPAVLIDSGENDARCPAWHGRKFAARLQEATTSDRPILLRVRVGAGHGVVGTASQVVQQAETLSFFADQLGLKVI